MQKYNPNTEYKVDTNSPKVKKELNDSRQLYDEFKLRNIKQLDFADPATIDIAFEDAKQLGVFEKAHNIRELIFGKG